MIRKLLELVDLVKAHRTGSCWQGLEPLAWVVAEDNAVVWRLYVASQGLS